MLVFRGVVYVFDVFLCEGFVMEVEDMTSSIMI